MIVARAAAWLVLLGCIAMGAAPVPDAGRQAIAAGGYTVLTADLHVHSFPGDGGLLPWDIAGEARRRGLDVIALTNHNSMWSWRLMQRVAPDATGVIVLPGMELTSAGYHMTAVGLHTPVSWRQLPAAAAAAIHAQGGVAIAAHPLEPRPSRWEDAAIDALDGFEAASSNGTLAAMAPFTRRAVVRRPSIAPVGASDFHYFAPLGVCRTFVFATERSAAGVLDAIRSGRTVACDGRGEVYGPAELAASVSGECRATAATGPAWRWVDAVSTAGTWAALAALVALGAAERQLASSLRAPGRRKAAP